MTSNYSIGRLPSRDWRFMFSQRRIGSLLLAASSVVCLSACTSEAVDSPSANSVVSEGSAVNECPSGYRQFNHEDYVVKGGGGGYYPRTDLQRFMYGIDSDEAIYCSTVTDQMLYDAGKRVVANHPGLCDVADPTPNSAESASDPWGALDLIDTWSSNVLDPAVDEWIAATDGGPVLGWQDPPGKSSNLEQKQFLSKKAILISALGFCHYPWQTSKSYLG